MHFIFTSLCLDQESYFAVNFEQLTIPTPCEVIWLGYYQSHLNYLSDLKVPPP